MLLLAGGSAVYRQAPGRLLTVCRALEVAPLKPLGAIQLRAPPHLRERRKLQEKAAQDLAMNGTAAGKARVWTGQLQHQKLHVQAAQDLATTPIAAGNSTGCGSCPCVTCCRIRFCKTWPTRRCAWHRCRQVEHLCHVLDSVMTCYT